MDTMLNKTKAIDINDKITFLFDYFNQNIYSMGRTGNSIGEIWFKKSVINKYQKQKPVSLTKIDSFVKNEVATIIGCDSEVINELINRSYLSTIKVDKYPYIKVTKNSVYIFLKQYISLTKLISACKTTQKHLIHICKKSHINLITIKRKNGSYKHFIHIDLKAELIQKFKDNLSYKKQKSIRKNISVLSNEYLTKTEASKIIQCSMESINILIMNKFLAFKSQAKRPKTIILRSSVDVFTATYISLSSIANMNKTSVVKFLNICNYLGIKILSLKNKRGSQQAFIKHEEKVKLLSEFNLKTAKKNNSLINKEALQSKKFVTSLQASKSLNCSKEAAMLLIDKNFISVLSDSNLTQNSTLVSLNSINMFFNHYILFSALAKKNNTSPNYLYKLCDEFKIDYIFFTKNNFKLAILHYDNIDKVKEALDNNPSLAKKRFNNKNKLLTLHAEYINQQQACKLVGCDTRALNSLIENNFLRVNTDQFQHFIFISIKSINQFLSKFILLSKLATEKNTSSKNLLKQCKNSGIETIALKRNNGSTFSFIKLQEKELLC